MKKKIMIFIFMFVLLAVIVSIVVLANKEFNDDKTDLFEAAKEASSDNKTVVVVVDGIEIYQEIVDFLAAGEEISIKNSVEYTDEDNESLTVDTDKILQEQIRDAVVLNEAQKQGLSVSEKEAEEYTIQNYKIVKELGGEQYQFLIDYMTEMGLTEEEYLEMCTSVNQKKLTRANLYNKFVEDKNGSYNDLVAEYEEYVEELIEKADIEYK